MSGNIDDGTTSRGLIHGPTQAPVFNAGTWNRAIVSLSLFSRRLERVQRLMIARNLALIHVRDKYFIGNTLNHFLSRVGCVWDALGSLCVCEFFNRLCFFPPSLRFLPPNVYDNCHVAEGLKWFPISRWHGIHSLIPTGTSVLFQNTATVFCQVLLSLWSLFPPWCTTTCLFVRNEWVSFRPKCSKRHSSRKLKNKTNILKSSLKNGWHKSSVCDSYFHSSKNKTI